MIKYTLTEEQFQFSASDNTVTFYNSVNLTDILIISNVTTGQLLFNFACVGETGTLEEFVLTLNVDLVDGTSDDDELLIVLQKPNDDTMESLHGLTNNLLTVTNNNFKQLEDIKNLLKLILS